MGRVKTIKKKVGPSGTDKAIVDNTYNEIGQLRSRSVGGLENQTYDYNIRDWVLGVNRDFLNNPTATYFGYELGYDKTQTIIAGSNFASPQFNGNISGALWKSTGDKEVRSFNYTYDAANRLTAANFNQYTGGSFNKTAGLDFSVSALTYDPNGNILTQTQKGWKLNASVSIDQLTYRYKNTNTSNLLLEVTDAINSSTSKLGDFKDGANAAGTDDYAMMKTAI